MSAKEEISHLIKGLSEYECAHLLSSFQLVSAGERFWETEISAVYSEHVKTRLSQRNQVSDEAVPGGPDSGGGVFAPIPVMKEYRNAERVPLPEPSELDAPIGAVLAKRRSRRDYTGEPISGEQLSTLLGHSAGVNGTVAGYGYQKLPLRQFPSSGGLQASESYVSIQGVTGIAPGLYHYHIGDHALERLRDGQHGPLLRELAFHQTYVQTAAVVFLTTGCFERLRWKYGQRGYKYMCMDAGYVGQNIYLVAEAMGLGACAIAGFVEDAIEQLLGVDSRHEMILLLTTVGVRAG